MASSAALSSIGRMGGSGRSLSRPGPVQRQRAGIRCHDTSTAALFAPALAARMLELSHHRNLALPLCLYDCTNKLSLSTKMNRGEPPSPGMAIDRHVVNQDDFRTKSGDDPCCRMPLKSRPDRSMAGRRNQDRDAAPNPSSLKAMVLTSCRCRSVPAISPYPRARPRGLALGGCGTINEKLADGMGDYIPQWLGGLPADAPPRPGTPKYDEYMKEREEKRLQPAPARMKPPKPLHLRRRAVY